MAFLGFACLFCILTAGVTWIQESQRQVDTSLLDVYDGLYEQVLRESVFGQRERLLIMHQMLKCCGKMSGGIGTPDSLCDGTADMQDCLSVISNSLRAHWSWSQAIMLVCLGFTVHGMVLSSFLFFLLPRGSDWDRRGEYSLTKASKHPTANKDIPLALLLPLQTTEPSAV
ncbi:hypothetical protein GDO86_019077 [Hymenochirus boettgeri]|uniref:Uncharacterized protein n=1 Tax=Hymenochirus boettgeri TaxID=247094 RepID=A0A8T2ICZ7_9PIPI|nr:hypothetical protein GDO86_019077 [Hymenochirus boettgeri]